MIVLNGILPINDNHQWIFVTLTVDDDECKFTHAAPVDLTGQDLQDYVDAREDSYRLDILKDMYPGAVVIPTEDQTTLSAFEVWIADGCINPDGKVIYKQAWMGAHPVNMILFGEAGKLAAIKKEVECYIHSHYSAATQTSLSSLNQRPEITTEQKSSLRLVSEWIESILGYYYMKKAEISTDWESSTWDFNQFDNTKPTVTLGGILAMGTT